MVLGASKGGGSNAKLGVVIINEIIIVAWKYHIATVEIRTQTHVTVPQHGPH